MFLALAPLKWSLPEICQRVTVDLTMPVELFNSQNARILAAKSALVRRERRAALSVVPMPEPLKAGSKPEKVNDFTEGRIACVRAQLGRIDRMLLTETDPQRLDRLASANAKLSDLERVMSGRPLPGQLRPRASKSLKSDPSDVVPE